MISYYKYYLELKNRGGLLLLTWLSLMIVCYSYKETLLFFLVKPTNHLAEIHDESYFIFTNISEIFYVYLNLVFFIANQFTFIAIFYHVLMFLSFGLYSLELIRLKSAFRVFFFSWLFSFIFLYKFLVPFSWSFFLSFQKSTISFIFEAKIVEYLEYFINLYYICLANCQLLGFLTLILANISKDIKKIKTFRKLFYFTFLIFSTLTTPPDVISQVLLTSTLAALYELFIFLKCLKTNMEAS